VRSAGNFHPEWGYLAPAPSFMRTARIALVATAIGATAGAVVVVSLVAHPGADAENTSIAAHALVTAPPVVVTSPVPPVAKASPAAAPAAMAAQQQATTPSAAQTPSVASTTDGSASAGKLNTASPQSQTPVAAASVAAVTPPPAVAAEPASDQPDGAAPDATPDKKAKKHHVANNDAVRRWEAGSEARKRWRDDRGLGPLLRLFSFRTGSSDYSN
jgi:ribonuclease E